MAIIKCKMCGGDLVLVEGQSVAECEYCGSRQTVPVVDNEKKMTLFARAGRLRAACEFDKAAGIYETIVADYPEEAESYWGLVLCKYGIEYVDDPASGRKIPTCHRSSFDSVMDDENFEQAMENADEEALRVYRQEAKQIEQIRKGILAVSSSEKPYDIFICYKETDSSGDRTVDSLLAQDIYDALIAKGYRVFFSRITLEDKLGQAYEPYIFAALNSAKIMLAVGTCYEHYNAVWVKNEWSRYLKIIAQDKGKYLIPCYKNIDAYDIPREFAHLQGQDMGKVGAVADLLRGVEKLLPRKAEVRQETAEVQKAAESSPTDPLLQRAFLFLEDGNWSRADEYCEKVLDRNPKCAEAYLGKMLAELKVPRKEELAHCKDSFGSNDHYKKVLRFAEPALKAELEAIQDFVDTVLESTGNSHIVNGTLNRYNGSQSRVILPGSIRVIGKDAFYGCGNLKSIEIPDSVTEIGSGIFSGCDNLSQIQVSAKNANFRASGTCLIDKRTKTVISGLDFQDLPTDGSIRHIGDNAFCGSEKLTEISVPEGVVSIGREAFGDCSRLQSVALPDSVTAIAPDAIPHNPGLRIALAEDHPVYRLAGSCLIHKQEKTVIFGTRIQDLPTDGSVTGIGEYAFYGCEMPEALEIPGCISSIGAYAFYGCRNLKAITFPGRTVKIADNAFDRDSGHLTVYAFADSDAARWARKNRISTQENEDMKRISTAALLEKGNLALKEGDWNRASGFFDDVLHNDSRNAVAYLGKTLVQEHCHTLSGLVLQQANTYRTVSVQKLYLKENTEHIDEMAAKYSLPGYVEEKAIRELYRFDLSYTSEVSGRQKQYLEAAGWWKNHKQLSQAEAFASGELAEQMQQEKKRLLNQMNQQIQKAREQETWNLAKVKEAYEAHLAEADQAAERLYNEGVALREQQYQSWVEQAQQETDPKKLKALAENFAALGEYMDCAEQAQYCRSRAAEEQKKLAQEKEQRRAANAQKKKARRKRARPIIALVAIITVVCLVVTGPVAQLVVNSAPQMTAAAREVIESVPMLQYLNARILAANGKYEAAVADFDALGDYRDAAERGDEAAYLWAEELFAAEQYAQALAVLETVDGYKDSTGRIAECKDRIEVLELAALEATGKLRQAALGYYKRGEREKSMELWNLSADRETVSIGTYHTVALRNDGTVAVAGSNWDYKKKTISPNGQCDVDQWKDIVDIEAGSYHTVGLRSDGTVVATGQNSLGQCDVSDWTDIAAVAAGEGYSAGLRSDGTVMVVGNETVSAASEWTDIISLSGGDEIIIGLRSDGTTVSTKPQIVAPRENVTKAAIGTAYVFLHEDGSVSSPYRATEGVKNVVDIFAGSVAIVCRGNDGTLTTNFLRIFDNNGVHDWNQLERDDIVAFCDGDNHAVVLHSDGTLAATGDNKAGQCNVSDWRNIKVPQSPAVNLVPRDIQTEEEKLDFAAEYRNAEYLLQQGKVAEAAIAFGKLDGYGDARERSIALWDKVAVRETIAVSDYHTLALKNDGSVLAVGIHDKNLCGANKWKNVVALAATNEASFGLKSDGTVVTTQSTDIANSGVGQWKDIVSISDDGTVGLRMDGTVATTSHRFDLSGWTDIVAVYSLPGSQPVVSVIVGVKTDGTFVVAGPTEINKDWRMPDLDDWKDIVLFDGDNFNYNPAAVIMGLKADGTVVVSKDGFFGRSYYNVSHWRNIVQIEVGRNAYVMGVTANGSVVYAGQYPDGCNTNGWKNIVSVAAGAYHAVGLKSDGTLVATGDPKYGRCNVSEWSDIKLPNNQKDVVKPATYQTAESMKKYAAYREAEDLLAGGEIAKAALAFGKLGDYEDSREQSLALWDSLRNKQTISAGRFRTMAVQENGSVLISDGSRLSGGMAAVSDGNWHYVGLRSNGTVEGKTSNDQMSGLDSGVFYTNNVRQPHRPNVVSSWENIQAVSAGDAHTVGLCTDGTAVAAGDDNNQYGRLKVGGWKDLIAVSAGFDHTVGLRSDGTVLSTLSDTTDWKDIKAISAGKFFTVGLQKDGTVTAAGSNDFGQCDVSNWLDVVAVSAGDTHTVALLADGTVVAVGGNEYGQCNVDGWHDIVAIDAGSWHTVGLRSDGTLLAVGLSEEGRCDVGSWTKVKLPQ